MQVSQSSVFCCESVVNEVRYDPWANVVILQVSKMLDDMKNEVHHDERGKNRRSKESSLIATSPKSTL